MWVVPWQKCAWTCLCVTSFRCVREYTCLCVWVCVCVGYMWVYVSICEFQILRRRMLQLWFRCYLNKTPSKLPDWLFAVFCINRASLKLERTNMLKVLYLLLIGLVSALLNDFFLDVSTLYLPVFFMWCWFPMDGRYHIHPNLPEENRRVPGRNVVKQNKIKQNN